MVPSSAVQIPNLSQEENKPHRHKKQMNFQTREEMLRYIENFRMNYKTEMCRNWLKLGHCEFDQECAYAHGHHELVQRPVVHKNYKTKMCRKWHETTPGQCSYGDKCQFIHDEPQRSFEEADRRLAKMGLKFFDVQDVTEAATLKSSTAAAETQFTSIFENTKFVEPCAPQVDFSAIEQNIENEILNSSHDSMDVSS
jgi:hypothetical protein